MDPPPPPGECAVPAIEKAEARTEEINKDRKNIPARALSQKKKLSLAKTWLRKKKVTSFSFREEKALAFLSLLLLFSPPHLCSETPKNIKLWRMI